MTHERFHASQARGNSRRTRGAARHPLWHREASDENEGARQEGGRSVQSGYEFAWARRNAGAHNPTEHRSSKEHFPSALHHGSVVPASCLRAGDSERRVDGSTRSECRSLRVASAPPGAFLPRCRRPTAVRATWALPPHLLGDDGARATGVETMDLVSSRPERERERSSARLGARLCLTSSLGSVSFVRPRTDLTTSTHPTHDMSEAALEKVQLERDGLAKELQLVQSAIPKDKSVELLASPAARRSSLLGVRSAR